MGKSGVEIAAEVAHEVNRAYCRGIRDFTQVPWDDAPQWQKDSAVRGAQLINDIPDTGPEASHASWLAEKKAEGWIYGETKDVEKKIHPCFVPYDKLPAAQKAKDALFGAAVRGVLAQMA